MWPAGLSIGSILTINFGNLAATSAAAGFLNEERPKTGSVDVPAQNLAADTYKRYDVTLSMDNANAISQVSVNYSLETFWNVAISGKVIAPFDGSSHDYASPTYTVSSQVFFSGTTLTVITLVQENTGGTTAVPAFTVNVSASVFEAPF